MGGRGGTAAAVEGGRHFFLMLWGEGVSVLMGWWGEVGLGMGRLVGYRGRIVVVVGGAGRAGRGRFRWGKGGEWKMIWRVFSSRR